MTKESTPSDWYFDPAKADFSLEAQQACDLRFDLDEDHWLQLIEFGTWWVLPIARTFTDKIIGIRLIPGLRLDQSPVVKLVEHEALTLASQPAYLVPRMMLGGAMANTDRWNIKRDLPTSTWDELERLHEALTGRDNLGSIRGVLNDTRHRDASGQAFADPEAFERALPSLLSAVDSAPETSRFREYAENAVARGEVSVPVPDFGCWTASAAAMTFLTTSSIRYGFSVDAQLEAAWSVMQQPPGLDSFQEGVPTHLAQPTGQSQEGIPRLAAEMLTAHASRCPAAWTSSPLWAPILAISERDGRPGVAHIKAAQGLAASGDQVAAFTSLIAGAYWMRVATDEPFPQLLQAARMMAHQSGWTTVAQALDEVAQQAMLADPSLA